MAEVRMEVVRVLPVLALYFVCVFGQTEYMVGTGIFDITGPAAEVNLVSCSLAH
jgi:hypothetical protein